LPADAPKNANSGTAAGPARQLDSRGGLSHRRDGMDRVAFGPRFSFLALCASEPIPVPCMFLSFAPLAVFRFLLSRYMKISTCYEDTYGARCGSTSLRGSRLSLFSVFPMLPRLSLTFSSRTCLIWMVRSKGFELRRGSLVTVLQGWHACYQGETG
jgi:hypothetical protein